MITLPQKEIEMFAGRSLAKARIQAQANADLKNEDWCLFTDTASNLHICPDWRGPDDVIEVISPEKKKGPSMLERLEALCRTVATLDDNGPDPKVYDVKQEAESLIAKFFTPEGD